MLGPRAGDFIGADCAGVAPSSCSASPLDVLCELSLLDWNLSDVRLGRSSLDRIVLTGGGLRKRGDIGHRGISFRSFGGPALLGPAVTIALSE